MEKRQTIRLTTKQTWLLATIALSEGLTKYDIEQLWSKVLWPSRPFKVPVSDNESFNMRKTLDSLVERKLIKKIQGKKGITLYHIFSWEPGLYLAGQPYKPYTTRTMCHLSSDYLKT